MKYNKFLLCILFGLIFCAFIGSIFLFIGLFKNAAACFAFSAILWVVGAALFMSEDNLEEIITVKTCDCGDRKLMYKAISYDKYECKQCGKELIIEKDWTDKINCN